MFNLIMPHIVAATLCLTPPPIDVSSCRQDWMQPAAFLRLVQVELSEMNGDQFTPESDIRLECTDNSVHITIYSQDNAPDNARFKPISTRIQLSYNNGDDISDDNEGVSHMRLVAMTVSDLVREWIEQGEAIRIQKENKEGRKANKNPIQVSGPSANAPAVPPKSEPNNENVTDTTTMLPAALSPNRRSIFSLESMYFFHHQTVSPQIGAMRQWYRFQLGISALGTFHTSDVGPIYMLAPLGRVGWNLCDYPVRNSHWGIDGEAYAGAIFSWGSSKIGYTDTAKARGLVGIRLSLWMQWFAKQRLSLRGYVFAGWLRGMNAIVVNEEVAGINGIFLGIGIAPVVSRTR